MGREEAYGDNVQIFRVSDGTLVRTLPGDPNGFVQGVAFAPNGSALALRAPILNLVALAALEELSSLVDLRKQQ